jgi:hypothetical protein
MGDWANVRKKAREVVHGTFSLPAFFSSKDGTVVDAAINVRLHNKLERFGDLDREGYARVIEHVNQIVFDSEEVVPQEGTLTFSFVDEPALIYKVINIIDSPDGSRFVSAEVARKPNP